MMRISPPSRLPRIVLAALAGVCLCHSAPAAAAPLPRFSEEREAAAQFFVKKHCPELLPLLEELKKNSRSQYEQQVREVFQLTEMLAEIGDERRHDLELRIWKTENKAFVAVARLATAKDEERKTIESQLHRLAKDLVELEIQSLEIQAGQLEKEFLETKAEVVRLKENLDKVSKERVDQLLEKAKGRKKSPAAAAPAQAPTPYSK
jgi:hypothetical protein